MMSSPKTNITNATLSAGDCEVSTLPISALEELGKGKR